MRGAEPGTTTVLAPFSGVARSLADVPDAAFAEGLLGGGLAIDPLDELVVAPFDGVVTALAPTGHSVTLRSRTGIELLIHVGIDTVRLNHQGFETLVSQGQELATGTPLIRLDLDYIAAHAKDCVTPIIVLSEGASIEDCCPDGPIMAGETLFTVRATSAAERVADAGDSTLARLKVTIALPHGIHARPAARISSFARSQTARIALLRADQSADAASTTELMKLGAAKGDELAVQVMGKDARKIALDLAALLSEMAEAEARNEHAALPEQSQPAGKQPLSATERRGVRAAPGLAVGPVMQLRETDPNLPEHARSIEVEHDALQQGINAVRADLENLIASGTTLTRQIAEAHLAVLDDQALKSDAIRQIDAGSSAAAAWREASREQEAGLVATGNERLRERTIDFRDVERRVIAAIHPGLDPGQANRIAPGSILLCDEIQPSILMGPGAADIAAICCARGGATSHAAILAAAAGIPMIVSLGADIRSIADGATVTVDADGAVVNLGPSIDEQALFGQRIEEAAKAQQRARAAAAEDCYLADGTRIEVFANLSSVEGARQAVQQGAEGCGLLRTEFLFSDRDEAPDESEQAEVLGAIAGALEGRPLIVRTLDVGGDKPLPYFPFATEENPALGMRGVRFTSLHPHVVRTQLRAMLAAVPAAALRVMIPMVVEVEEFVRVREILDEVKNDLGYEADVPLGIMIETPAAALLSEQLARLADFFSIGSNDLSQYVLAMDRGNTGLAERVDALHPAVLQAIAQTAAGAAKHGRWLGLCGGLASEPDAAPLLVGLGCVELSAVPRAIPSIKEALRRWTLAECRALAHEALDKTGAAQVRQLLAGAQK